MLLNDILCEIDYELLSGTTDLKIVDIVYDSKLVVPGVVFVCLKGANFDGHDYVREAKEKGAVAFICEKEINMSNMTIVKVSDTRICLARMSANFFNHPSKKLKTIGITGTNGKTTTAFMIKRIIECSGQKCGMIGTIGIFNGNDMLKSKNTTPESYEIQKALYLMVNNGCKYAVMEVSSLGLKWHRTSEIFFDCAIFTNFSEDHISKNEHNTIEEYMACKRLLFDQCALGFSNGDDKVVSSLLSDCECDVHTYGFSFGEDIVAFNQSLVSTPGYLGVTFDVSGAFSGKVNVNLPGKFNVYNALAAISVCDYLGFSKKDILCGLNTVKVKGRSEIVDVPGDYTLIIDFAHNAISMKNFLLTLREYNPNRIITLFGAGGDRSKMRRYDMGKVSGTFSDITVVTEDNSRTESVEKILCDIESGVQHAGGDYVVIKDRAEAIKYCLKIAKPGDIIVLAGKGHEDYQIYGTQKIYFDERKIVREVLFEK